jgi:hypothetical protein
VTQGHRLELYSDLIHQEEMSFNTLGLITLDQDLELSTSFGHIDNGAVERIHQIHEHGLSTSIILPLAYKALRLFYHRIPVTISAGKSSIAQHYNFSKPQLASFPIPPVACQIPFSTFMTAPLPFSFSSADIFHNCHLPVMTTPEFIESGEWAGYVFSNQNMQPGGQPAVIIPIQGIRFSTIVHEENYILDLCSITLFDSVKSSFHFEGKLLRDRGKMILVLCFHTSGTKIPMQGIVTPFGIVASHGYRNFRLWIWLWKAEWSTSLSIDQ